MGYCIIHDAYNGNGLCKYCYPPSETSDSTATAAPPSAIDNRTYAAMVDRIAELEVERDRLRLRARVLRLEADSGAWEATAQAHYEQVTKLRAKNERLREAVTKLIELVEGEEGMLGLEDMMDGYYSGCLDIEGTLAFARAALEGQDMSKEES